MNKFSSLLIVSLFISVSSRAQTQVDGQSPYKNELGLDMTLLMSNLFGFHDYYYVYDIYPNYGSANPGLYLLTYRHYIGNGALRFGAGSDIYNAKTTADGVDATNESSNSRIDFRAGYEFDKQLGKRWNLFYGLDLNINLISTDYTYSYPDNNYNYTSKSSTTGFGGGPIIGVSWFINDRIKLSTDASLQYAMSDTETKTSYDLTPELNSTTHTTTGNLAANYPMFLYFEFLF